MSEEKRTIGGECYPFPTDRHGWFIESEDRTDHVVLTAVDASHAEGAFRRVRFPVALQRSDAVALRDWLNEWIGEDDE